MSSITGSNLNGITVTPKFIFGVNGEIKQNIYLLEDHRLIYSAGHNIILYNTEDKSQYTFPAMDGTEGITCINVSASKKYLVICEKAARAVWTIYEIQHQKVRRSLVKGDGEGTGVYQSKEFIACSFSAKNEKTHLLTLTGEPDWSLILWKWDSSKIQAMINIGFSLPQTPNMPFQCSFNPFDPNAVIVTGPSTYKYLKIQDTEFVIDHSQLNNLDYGHMHHPKEGSLNYVCHAWMTDTARIVVCTEAGDIMVCENSGEFYTYVERDERQKIKAIVPYGKGFVLGYGNGMFTAYERYEDGQTGIATYRRFKEVFTSLEQPYQLTNFPVSSMVLTTTEDQIYFITENNQLLKVNFSLDGLEEKSKFEYVICNFHSMAVTGMDVCIRKQLVVTCSRDKTIRIWNYANRTLEIVSGVLSDETLAVAFHPSGFHVICALLDKISIYNVLGQEFSSQPRTLQIKACREIKFSHGGHLFACAVGNNAIWVYNFYTEDCPQYYQCKGHVNKVRCIDWFENDTGFTSCGIDGNVYFYDLIVQKENQQRLNDKDFNQKNINFTSVVNIPGKPFEMYAVGNDRKIWHSKDNKNGFDAGIQLSQIVLTSNQKALIAGVGEEGKPGAIHIFQVPQLGKINEVQAHSKPIERMKISYDNNFLFTGGQDGLFVIHDIKDRADSRSQKPAREALGLPFSEEILIDKQDIENFISEKEQLEGDFQSSGGQTENVALMVEISKKNEEKDKAQERFTSESAAQKSTLQSIAENKRDIENSKEDEIRQFAEKCQAELQLKWEAYSQQMLQDAANYQKLQAEKEQQQLENENKINRIVKEHNKRVSEKLEQFRKDMETAKNTTEQLRNDIRQIREDNEETLDQIRRDAQYEIDEINKKNMANQTQVQDMSLKSKAELQLTKNKHQDLESDIEKLKRDKQEKSIQVSTQTEVLKSLQKEIRDQAAEISAKDKLIGDREKKIYQLKKKTQELEKFKFVLDYKIKELKRDIAPREMEITRLKKETHEMDKNLKHYNKINANLGYIVDDLRTRQEHMQDLIRKNRSKIRANDIFIKGFTNAVYRTVQFIDDFDLLKRSVNENLYPYVKDQEIKNVEIDPDIKKEYENQKRYLENSVNSLKKRLEKETSIHKEDNNNIMKENMELINQIATLRREVTLLNSQLRNQDSKLQAIQNQGLLDSQMSGGTGGGQDIAAKLMQNQMATSQSFENTQLHMQDLQMKRQYIDELRKKLNILVDENRYLKSEIANNQQHQQLAQEEDQE